MFFASDNWAGAHHVITDSLARHSGGHVPAYGASALDNAVEQKLCEIFEREVAVFFVATGTAANSLALASVSRPGGVTFCHRQAHVIADECGAPEWFASGSRLFPVDGAKGKMDPDQLRDAIGRYPDGAVHSGQAMAVTITQATELGSVYSLSEIAAISETARTRGLPLHMDGARFANSLVSLGCSPAEMTWKRGVDILSFGGTKNGCWCAEALIFMNPQDAKQMPYLRKRAGQLFSKSRFIAAQFEAYLQDDLWLSLARHANQKALDLAAIIEKSSAIRLAWRPEANEVFAVMQKDRLSELRARGAALYEWPMPDGAQTALGNSEVLVRLVTSFATTDEEVANFAENASN